MGAEKTTSRMGWISRGSIILVVIAMVGVVFALPASAVGTGTIAVCATDSTGANIVLGNDQAWYKVGSSSYVGPVGVSGCRESTLGGGTSVEVWVAKNGTTSNHLTGVVPSDGSTLRFDFFTTKVTLQYSGGLAFGGPNGDSAWFAKPSMELFSNGVNPIRFRLDGTGGASGRLGLLWPVATGTGQSFTRSLIALRLRDSTGAPLNGGTARYQYGSWQFVPGSTGNEPTAPGILSYAISGLAGNVTNEMRYNNTIQTVTQNAASNSVFQFQTRKLTLRLETCGGVPLDGGKARYGTGATFSTWWFPGGLTGSSAPGETAAQVFPGTYSFEMQYKGTADQKLSVAVPNADSMITWQTTKVTLNYSGAISYGGPTGDSAWFTKPSMELLPGTYMFDFRGGDRVALTISGCTFEKTVVALKVVESDGVTGVPGVTFVWQIHGFPPDQAVPGATNSSGVLLHVMDGYNNSPTRYLPTYMGGVGPRMDPLPATQSLVTWKLIDVTVRLTDVYGNLINASPLVTFEYPGGGRQVFGNLSGGQASLQMMPTAGYVAFFIDNFNNTSGRMDASPMNTSPYTLTFQAGRIVDDFGYLDHWRISGGVNTSVVGSPYKVDVLPNTSFYVYPTANESPRQGPIAIGAGQTLTFTDGSGAYTITP
jgi:hypothetical protein